MPSGFAAPQPLALALALSVTVLSVPVLSDSGPSQTTVDAGPASTVQVDSEPSSSADSLLEEADPDALFAAGSRDASERSYARPSTSYGVVVEPDAVMVGDGVSEDEAGSDGTAASEEVALAEAAGDDVAGDDREAGEARASNGANRANSAADAGGSSSATTSAPTRSAEPEPSRVTPATTSPPTTAVPTTAPSTSAAPPTTAPPATAPPTTAAPTTAPAADSAAPGEPTAAQWQALRQCEAWGDYTVVSGNGLYFGAYQFSQRTWDTTARAAGRTDLVGLPPHQAAPADQDALALALWRQAGWSPWPHCGKQARGA